MNLHKCLLTGNDCYRAGRTITPKGVMVHSTGANNPRLSRYVAPNDGLLGEPSLRHWNQSGVGACPHAFIGRLADGSVATYQVLPWTMRGWHCGTGTSGISANNTHISFEICEDGLEDAGYFNAVYREAVELTAMLCREYSLDPLADGVVICHAEGYQRGIASNHADVLHWFPKYGKTVDDFRADVAQVVKGESDLTEEQVRAIAREEYKKIEAERAGRTASVWAVPYIQQAVDGGIMAESGDGSIARPGDYITREETATVAAALLRKMRE